MHSTFFPSRQGSSAVEQGTHKPLVGSSILPPGISVYGVGVYFAWITRAALYWFDARFGRSTCSTSPWSYAHDKANRRISSCSSARVLDTEGSARYRATPKSEKESSSCNSLSKQVEQPLKAFGVGREFESPPWHFLQFQFPIYGCRLIPI